MCLHTHCQKGQMYNIGCEHMTVMQRSHRAKPRCIKRGKRDNAPPLQQVVRSHGGSKGNTTYPIELTGRTSLKCDRKLGCKSCTFVTGGPGSVDTSAGGLKV